MQNKPVQQRLRSLDTLRGFDMLFIMGGSPLIASLAILFPTPFFQALAEQTRHVAWNGFHCQDMIFPLFLFIAGISFPFSLAKQRANNRSERDIHLKIITRGILLVILGILYNGFLQFDFESQRYASVLGRIGLAWMFGALIFMHTNNKARIITTVAILVAYWLAMAFIPLSNPEGVDRFSMEGVLTGHIDRAILPGQLHNGIHDPEGLFSTIPAIATALLGMLTGNFIKNGIGIKDTQKCLRLAGIGVALIITGCIWNVVFPINKHIWSSSFVCFVGGISMLLFTLFYYIVDVKGHTKWTTFFIVIGMNSITIYIAQHFISFKFTAQAVFGGLISWLPENAQSFGESAAYIATCWLFLYFLYRKRVFLKV